MVRKKGPQWARGKVACDQPRQDDDRASVAFWGEAQQGQARQKRAEFMDRAALEHERRFGRRSNDLDRCEHSFTPREYPGGRRRLSRALAWTGAAIVGPPFPNFKCNRTPCGTGIAVLRRHEGLK